MSHASAASEWHPALTGVALILLDFDGPIVRLLPDPEHLDLADDLVRWGSERTGEPPAGPAHDHVQVLRRLHQEHPELATEAEARATRVEKTAADRRSAYPDAIATMRRWLHAGGRLAIVSNNADEAVRQVLLREDFGVPPGDAYTVHARRADGIGRLKPRPDLLLEAMARHGVPVDRAVMIGDTAGDVRAGTAAGVPTIGVAESADRADELRAVGAVAVVSRLADLVQVPPQQ